MLLKKEEVNKEVKIDFDNLTQYYLCSIHLLLITQDKEFSNYLFH